MAIPESHYRAACRMASQVFSGAVLRADGVKRLAKEFGLNEASAADYINDYKCLVLGRIFFRKMSAPAVSYFISEIEREHGPVGLINAITSLNAHIAYVEQHYQINSKSLRKAAADASIRLRTVDARDVEAALQSGVEKSLEDDQAELLIRLASAPKKAQLVMVTSRAFLRNPDVVTAVLLRANGKCEACKADAPFISAATGRPYLEVHHRVKLSDHGDDTVENAAALCPNCHRKAHFGAVDA